MCQASLDKEPCHNLPTHPKPNTRDHKQVTYVFKGYRMDLPSRAAARCLSVCLSPPSVQLAPVGHPGLGLEGSPVLAVQLPADKPNSEGGEASGGRRGLSLEDAYTGL